MNLDLGSAGDSAEEKKESVLERLNKRNKERQNNLDVQLEERSKEQLELEGADYFRQSFAERVEKIEARLQRLREMSQLSLNSRDSEKDERELKRVFADTLREIQELQNYLTSSTLFLSDYKVKSCQNVINKLMLHCEELRDQLVPKKKFGFSGKKVTPSTKALALEKLDKVDSKEKSKKDKAKKSNFEWTFSDRKAEYLCLTGDEVNGKDITLSDLHHCFIEIQGHPGSLQISDMDHCILVCGPVARSVFVEQCFHSMMVVACQQLRLHTSHMCRVYLYVTSRAIIEDSDCIEVTKYNYDYLNIEYDFFMSGLPDGQNNYDDIADFNWLSPDAPSPNWKVLKNVPPVNWDVVRERFKQTGSLAI